MAMATTERQLTLPTPQELADAGQLMLDASAALDELRMRLLAIHKHFQNQKIDASLDGVVIDDAYIGCLFRNVEDYVCFSEVTADIVSNLEELLRKIDMHGRDTAPPRRRFASANSELKS